LLLFLAPLFCAYLLHVVSKATMSAILSRFDLPLFLVASLLRPLHYFLNYCPGEISDDKNILVFKKDIAALQRRIAILEGQGLSRSIEMAPIDPNASKAWLSELSKSVDSLQRQMLLIQKPVRRKGLTHYFWSALMAPPKLCWSLLRFII